jgi:hypothetical protein
MTRLPSLLLPGQLDLFAIPSVPVSDVARPLIPGRRARHEPRGHIYNLATHFDIINRVIFKGQLDAPTLRWSRNRWRYTLGLCDVKKRIITINVALDDARVPELVVAAVMHHEMLHLYFGVSEGPNGGRRFHTPQYRTAERAFPGYQESEHWLAKFWPLRGRPARKPREQDASFLSYLGSMDPFTPPPVRKLPDPVQSTKLEFPDR